jgi:hypothetical protein
VSRRRRHRGQRVPGLFGFDDGAPTAEVDEIPDNPQTRPCPACGATAGQACRTRTRRPTRMNDYHPARKSPQETT